MSGTWCVEAVLMAESKVLAYTMRAVYVGRVEVDI